MSKTKVRRPDISGVRSSRGGKHLVRGAAAASGLLMLAGCGAESEVGDDFTAADEAVLSSELGIAEQALSAACGGDDSNALSAALAVAIGNELGRWDVNTDFAIVSGKLELSSTG